MNRPSLMSLSSSCLGYCKCINSQLLMFLIMLLYLTRLPSRHFFGRRSYSADPDVKPNSLSTHNQTHVLFHRFFSFPVNWSLDSVLVCNSATRHIAVIPKTIWKGISPIYMANPSESGQPATDTGEVPDWLSEFRRKKAESSKKCRARAESSRKCRARPAGEKKSPVPGMLRVKQCRERKARIASTESTTGTVSNNSM